MCIYILYVSRKIIIKTILGKVSMFYERWSWSSNAKDIGVLYLIFSIFSGLVGTAFSSLIRIELSAPGVQFIGDNQLYNSIITAHALVMIFLWSTYCLCLMQTLKNCIYEFLKLNNNTKRTMYNNNNIKHKFWKLVVNNPF